MRSPEARQLLNEVVRLARELALTDTRSFDYASKRWNLEFAILDYDKFCREPHYTVGVDVANSSSTAEYQTSQTTKGQHFGLPSGAIKS